MINDVYSKANVNSKGRETKIIKVHRQTDRYTHNYIYYAILCGTILIISKSSTFSIIKLIQCTIKANNSPSSYIATVPLYNKQNNLTIQHCNSYLI